MREEDPKRQSFASLGNFMSLPTLPTEQPGPSEERRASDQSVASLDITTALRGLPSPATIPHVRHDEAEPQTTSQNHSQEDLAQFMITTDPATPLAPFSPVRLRHRSPSRSFAGVSLSSLPPAMTDEVDVDLRLTYTPVHPRFMHRASPRRESHDTSEALHSIASSSRRPSRFTLPPLLPEDASVPATPGLAEGDPSSGTIISLNSPTTPESQLVKTPTVHKTSPGVKIAGHQCRPSGSRLAMLRSEDNTLGLAYSPRQTRFAPLYPASDALDPSASSAAESARTSTPNKRSTYSPHPEVIPMQPLQALRAKAASRLSLPARAMAPDSPAPSLRSPFAPTSTPERRRPLSHLPSLALDTTHELHQGSRPSSRNGSLRSIPTAPLPSRLLERRQRRAAELAAATRRLRGEEAEDAERKLAELEIQL